jgi:site-specific DNA recombinase
MIAIGYVRRSAKSEENTVSLQEQERQIRDYCERKGFTVAAVVSHDGISGAKRSRWDEIHQAVRGNDAGVVVIYNLDRLSRDAAGLLDNLRRLASLGVAVHEVSSGVLDLKKSTSKLTISVRGVMDEFYRDVVSEKTADALRYKRQNGLQYTHVPPFGFSYLHGKLVKHTEEQRALDIISSCRQNGFGARRTKKALLDAGYSGRMGVATIHRLLHAETGTSSIKEKLPATYFALAD